MRRSRRTTTAAAPGRPCAWPSVSPMSRPSGAYARAARGGGQIADVGDRQEPQGFGEGIRPHLRLHRRHHPCAEGTGPQLQPLRAGAGHPRADPPRAHGRGAVHGAVQLPAERNLHHADPGADHGQHRSVQTGQVRRTADPPAAFEAFRDSFPAGSSTSSTVAVARRSAR